MGNDGAPRQFVFAPSLTECDVSPGIFFLQFLEYLFRLPKIDFDLFATYALRIASRVS